MGGSARRSANPSSPRNLLVLLSLCFPSHPMRHCFRPSETYPTKALPKALCQPRNQENVSAIRHATQKGRYTVWTRTASYDASEASHSRAFRELECARLCEDFHKSWAVWCWAVPARLRCSRRLPPTLRVLNTKPGTC